MSIISPAAILAKHLINTGVFTGPSANSTWPLYISHLPDGDGVEDNAAAAYDSPGIKDGRLMSGNTIEHRGVQFILRFCPHDYLDGYSKGEALKTSMDAVKNTVVVVNTISYTILSVSLYTSLVPIGMEDGTKRRQKYSINFMVSMKED